MKYPCLVLDHDDTVVNSTATVHYPCFVKFLKQYFPHCTYTFEEYVIKNFSPGILPFFRDEVGMNEEMLQREYDFWDTYVQQHVPQAYAGMCEILWEQKNAGGLICVVSHSMEKNILRDYRENGLPQPDLIYGWDYPAHQRKPNPYPIEQILEKTGLRREELLVVDDLKPGYDMASACGVPFAAAGWAYDIPEIEDFMRRSCGLYFKTLAELKAHLA